MKPEITALQEAIVYKAETKLHSDIQEMAKLLSEQPLLSGNYSHEPLFTLAKPKSLDPINKKPQTITNLLKKLDGELYKQLFDENIEQYIDEETQNFIDNVERFQEKGVDLYIKWNPDHI